MQLPLNKFGFTQSSNFELARTWVSTEKIHFNCHLFFYCVCEISLFLLVEVVVCGASSWHFLAAFRLVLDQKSSRTSGILCPVGYFKRRRKRTNDVLTLVVRHAHHFDFLHKLKKFPAEIDKQEVLWWSWFSLTEFRIRYSQSTHFFLAPIISTRSEKIF